MSNKETLQEYNERLGTNNITLDSILETINKLPEAGSGEGAIGQKCIYLIKDGVVQVENTGEYSYKMTNGDAEVSVIEQDGYLGLCSKCWSDGTFTFANTFDLKRYSNIHIDFAYPSTSSPYAYQNATSILHVGSMSTYNTLFNKGATTQRKTVVAQIPDGSEEDTITFVCSNLGDGSTYTKYPFRLYNLYIENPDIQVQDKEIEITENGVYNITKDEDYIALNSVEVTVDVEPNLQDKDVEINENGVTTVTADEGFDGLNSVDITINVPTNGAPVINNAIDIIRNGVENTNLTGGHTYESIAGDKANFKEIQNNGYVTLTAKQWNRCWWKTVDKIDFKPFKTCKIYVDYSADKLSDTDASLYEWGVVLCESGTTIKLDHKPIVDGVGTFTRNVCEIDITDILPTLHEEYFVLQVANLTAQNSYTKYGVNFYNVWLEGEVDTEDMIVNITENGTTLITPSEGYRALNSVEVNVNVESSGGTYAPTYIKFDSYQGTDLQGDVNGLDTSNMVSMRNMLSSCGASSPDLDLRHFNTSNVTDMSYMFWGAHGLTSLNLNGFDTSKVWNIAQFVRGCSSLKHIDMRTMTFDSVTQKGYMFDGIPADCEIIVKGETEKTFVLNDRSSLTNVKTVAELE